MLELSDAKGLQVGALTRARARARTRTRTRTLALTLTLALSLALALILPLTLTLQAGFGAEELRLAGVRAPRAYARARVTVHVPGVHVSLYEAGLSPLLELRLESLAAAASYRPLVRVRARVRVRVTLTRGR